MEINWEPNAGATEEEIAILVAKTRKPLPEDYLNLLRKHNGGEGDLALEPMWLQLWCIKDVIENNQAAWREVVAVAITNGIPVPAFSSALAYYDGYRSGVLPANLLQAQRDYFGAHTYERVDKPRGEFFHTNWTGRGGTTASTTYTV